MLEWDKSRIFLSMLCGMYSVSIYIANGEMIRWVLIALRECYVAILSACALSLAGRGSSSYERSSS